MSHHALCPVTQVPTQPEPCVCLQLETAERDTADAIRGRILDYAATLDGKASRGVAMTCAGLSTTAGLR
jgi:hypothetical protein